MTIGSAAYRAAATLVGAAAPIARAFAGKQTVWRGSLTGASAELDRAAGSVWIHAASMGEVVAARTWVHALIGAGYRPPLLLTTRTGRGLSRARRELGDAVVARIAPVDAPQLVRSFLSRAIPGRLDLVETELWPHLIGESRRRSVPVVLVSASVSERTRRGLVRWGLAGPRFLGEGVWVLAQTDAHAVRFRSLGVPEARIAVTGDLKAEPPAPESARDPSSRPSVVFGSLRPGEERAAVAIARALAETGERTLVIAPRHGDGMDAARRALREAEIEISLRSEEERAREGLEAWLGRLRSGDPRRVGLLGTHGELPQAYASAAVAVVGGTFAPYGGHNVLEPAARGCAVIVGPHAEEVEAAVRALQRHGGVSVARDVSDLVSRLRETLASPETLRRMGQGAVRAAGEAANAPERSLEALHRFGLHP